MISQEVVHIFTWWILLFAIGIIFFPLSYIIFRKLEGRGYGFSKVIGTLCVSYLAFLLATFHVIPLKTPFLFTYLAIFVFVNYLIFLKCKREIVASVKKNLRMIILIEVLFSTGFLFWTTVRGYQPDINGLEKFMDYGFVNSIVRSDYLPPTDMWYAGGTINYYWFGHYVTAVLTKLTGIPSSITYNLMLATIAGFTLSQVFSLIATLLKNSEKKVNKRVIILTGIISAIVVVFAGNFHTPYYILKNGANKYWYPDATRFIGYNPDVNDKTIHEFPIYSFVVSDLHAHLINLPFVILFIALLWRTAEKKKLRILPDLLLPGCLLGTMFMTSAWDFGNYAITTGFVILFTRIRTMGIRFKAFWETAFRVGLIILFGLMTVLPFLLKFESIAQGIDFVHAHTPLWQLVILWGYPAVFTLLFLGLGYIYRKKLGLPDIFVFALLAASWSLIFIPEVFFIKDIYIATHHRANTMFKLTYQAFVMSYMASGYIGVRVLMWIKNKGMKLAFAIFFVVVFSLVLYYPKIAINSYYGNLKTYKGLDGETWLDLIHPEAHKAILWFRENINGQPIILEAPGDSYTEFNVISSYTGLPTVSGWFVHEWLWRGSSTIPSARVAEIDLIYRSNDLALTKNLLSKYKVVYVVVGEFERQKFPDLYEGKFGQIGQKVFTSGTTSIYKVN
jgi:uncharacterized membrane protein